MSTKEKLLAKLFDRKLPHNFTKQELSTLMAACHCEKASGGRGSGIRFYHRRSGRILAFDEPHPEKELYPYQIRMVRQFLKETGEVPGKE